ncbi:MAG: hypothetical protein IPM54_34120 [Polyangiaceae bacterium]|nr:hypothetical protein [Polyangiaceae bacterium]
MIALMLPPRVSNAQQADSQAIAAAQSLVDEASELMDANKFADACPKLEQAAKLVPTGVGAKLALAECYEGLGRLASAQGQYLQAEALARAAKDPRVKEAASKATKLKAKLATMTLKIPEALRNLEGVTLTWDELSIDQAIWGTPIPVDVGKHAIEVKAPGWRSWKEDVTIDANGRAFEQAVPSGKAARGKAPPLPDRPPRRGCPGGLPGAGGGARGARRRWPLPGSMRAMPKASVMRTICVTLPACRCAANRLDLRERRR